MLKVTTAAVDQFKAVLSQANKEGAYIRIYISGMG
jgi:Fe-S cluster assembly iron-binding protein IscA